MVTKPSPRAASPGPAAPLHRARRGELVGQHARGGHAARLPPPCTLLTHASVLAHTENLFFEATGGGVLACGWGRSILSYVLAGQGSVSLQRRLQETAAVWPGDLSSGPVTKFFIALI